MKLLTYRGTTWLVTIIALRLYGAATKQCQPIKESDYGSIQYSISGETIYAQLECSSGYVSTSGCAVAECKYGKWSHEVLHCRAVECKELNHPPNGRVKFPAVPIAYQSEAVYTCNTGYNLEGNNSRKCLVEGVWSGMEPTCVAVKCKRLNHPPNGRVKFPVPITYQSEAVYTCNTGYYLKGTSSRECLGDGVWSGTKPTCVAVQCKELHDPPNGGVEFPAPIMYQSEAVYTCNTGYNLNGNQPRKCLVNGVWSGKEPTCTATKKVNCGTPGVIDDGRAKFHSTTLHSKVIYRCKNPRCYSLQGDSVATCTRKGKWSNDGNLPTCTRKNFNPNKFKLPRRVKLKNKKAVHCGGRVGAHCPSGYKLIGTKHGTVKSRNNIKWKGKAPKCVRELP